MAPQTEAGLFRSAGYPRSRIESALNVYCPSGKIGSQRKEKQHLNDFIGTKLPAHRGSPDVGLL